MPQPVVQVASCPEPLYVKLPPAAVRRLPLRDYVERVSSLDQDELRQRLGLVRRKRGPRSLPMATRPSRTGEMSTAAHAVDADRRHAARAPGRPGWTSDLFALRYQAALERATPPHTYQSVADRFEMLDGSVGTDPDHLRKLMKRYGQTPG